MPTPNEIRSARLQAGMTQTEAGEHLNVARQTWTRYETGLRTMTDIEWYYWLHVTGIQRIPFRARPRAK